jgi:hypothetical protein
MNTNDTPGKTIEYLYDFHTKLFYNVLEGISEQDAGNRLNTKANHIAWLAGSLLYERSEILRLLGGKTDYQQNELFVGHKGLQEGQTYPTLADYIKDWDPVSKSLKEKLNSLTTADFNGPDPFDMPGEDVKLFDAFIFCMDRESYCIGQIGLYRRLLGYDAMKYD